MFLEIEQEIGLKLINKLPKKLKSWMIPEKIKQYALLNLFFYSIVEF